MRPTDLDAFNETLEGMPAAAILRWAWEAFAPDVLASSSFQTQSVPLLSLIAEETPELEVCFLDTGYHFPETIAFRDQLVEELGLRLRVLRASPTDAHQTSAGDLYRSDPDRCCFINKVEPIERALVGRRAWITGIRRDQTSARKSATFIAQRPDGIFKISPMLDWTAEDVAEWLRVRSLPRHPLTSMGYASIGCAPCTRPVADDEEDRAGRWAETYKTECGLHLDIRPADRS